MSADVRIDLNKGVFSAGDISLSLRPVLDAAAVQVGGDDGPCIRALSFGERFSLVSLSAGSSDPADAIAVTVLQAATVRQGSRKFTAEESAAVEALALSLAGAETAAPGFISTLMKVAHATGWTMEQVDAAPAGRIDQMVLQLNPAQAEADDGWTRLVFNSDQNDETSAGSIRERLARNLLQRLDSNSGSQLQTAAPDDDSAGVFKQAVFGSAVQSATQAPESESPESRVSSESPRPEVPQQAANNFADQRPAGVERKVAEFKSGDQPRTAGAVERDIASRAPEAPRQPTDDRIRRLTDPVPTATARSVAPRGTRTPDAPQAVRARVLEVDAGATRSAHNAASPSGPGLEPTFNAPRKQRSDSAGGLKTAEAVKQNAARILHAGNTTPRSDRRPRQTLNEQRTGAQLSAAELVGLLNASKPAPLHIGPEPVARAQSDRPQLREVDTTGRSTAEDELREQPAAAFGPSVNTFPRSWNREPSPSPDNLSLVQRRDEATSPEPVRTLPTQAHAAERQAQTLRAADDLARLLNEEADLRGID